MSGSGFSFFSRQNQFSAFLDILILSITKTKTYVADQINGRHKQSLPYFQSIYQEQLYYPLCIPSFFLEFWRIITFLLKTQNMMIKIPFSHCLRKNGFDEESSKTLLPNFPLLFELAHPRHSFYLKGEDNAFPR